MKKQYFSKSKFKNFGNTMLESFGKLGVQTHLAALRDGFGLILPIIIAGALSVLVRTFVFGAGSPPQSSILGWFAYAAGEVDKSNPNAHALLAGSNAATVSAMGNFAAYAVTNSTIGMLSVFFSMSFGYFLAVAKGSNTPIIAGFVGMGSFLTAILGKRALMDAQGIMTAILVTILAVEFFCVLEKSSKLTIKMPDGVPPAVARSFAKLLPAIIILTIVAFMNVPFMIMGHYTGHNPNFKIWGGTNEWTFGDAVYSGFQAPFLSLAGNGGTGLGIALIYVFAVSLLWFFGIHGTNVMLGIFSPIYLALYQENVKGAHHIFVQGTFDAFIFIGGAGATLAFIIALFLFSKREEERMIAKIAVGPGVFQINEPVIFGLPLILNGKYALPFILIPSILTATTYVAYKVIGVETVTVLIPWATPPILGALFATAMGWKAALLAIFNILLAFALWTPFVIFHSKKGQKKALVEVVSETQKVRA